MLRSLLPVAGAVLLFAACERAQGPEATTTDAVAIEATRGNDLVIDTAASALGFRGTKITGGHDGGFHDYEGTITATDTAVTGVTLTIRMPSIWSDNARLTNHLRSADFFEVERFPTATFESSQIERADSVGRKHLVTGNLTMRGVTQAITFPATITRTAEGARARAEFVIDRTKWGVVYKGQADNLISNDVTISFDVTARDAAPAVASDSAAASTRTSTAPATAPAGDTSGAAPSITTMQAQPQQ